MAAGKRPACLCQAKEIAQQIVNCFNGPGHAKCPAKGANNMSRLFFAFLGIFLVTFGVSAGAADTMDKTRIESIVHDYLLEHPEILREMSDKLQAKDKAAEEAARSSGLKANAQLVFHHNGDAIVGNPKGTVTMVEFMDYNCGWCKKSVGEVAALTAANKDLKVVFKEFPIFGQGSEYAARAALASVKQGKYWQLHQALFAQEVKITPEVVDEVAKSLGINVEKMKTDMKDAKILDTISTNYELAKALQIDGTPAFIIDAKVIPGYTAADQLQAQITAVKANGCQMC
jgi:protein-disulfide isomerase